MQQAWDAMPEGKGTCGRKMMERLGCCARYLPNGQLMSTDVALYEVPGSAAAVSLVCCQPRCIKYSGGLLVLDVR